MWDKWTFIFLFLFHCFFLLEYLFKSSSSNRNKANQTQELIKRRSKVHQRNMSREGALNFDQWEFGYGIFIKLPKINTCSFSLSSFKLKKRYPSTKKKYSDLKNCYIKPQNSCELNSRKLTPCEISHICPYDYNNNPI